MACYNGVVWLVRIRKRVHMGVSGLMVFIIASYTSHHPKRQFNFPLFYARMDALYFVDEGVRGCERSKGREATGRSGSVWRPATTPPSLKYPPEALSPPACRRPFLRSFLVSIVQHFRLSVRPSVHGACCKNGRPRPSLRFPVHATQSGVLVYYV